MNPLILVVDDERLIREPIGAALQLAGYEVALAADGREAVAAINGRVPALVLLDLEMPGISGMEVLRRVGGTVAPGRPKFIVLTATQDRAAVLAARDLGIKHFLLKSTFSLASLLARIKQVLEEQPDAGKPEEVGGNAAPAAHADDAASDGAAHADGTALSQDEVNERLRALKPVMTRDELMKRVADGSDLRALAPAVRRVLTLTSSEGASLDAIAKAIKQDQALSLKVLKVANSPVYAHVERVESVQKAVARIGVAQIRTIVTSLSVIDQFSGVNLGGRVRAEWFWEHSIACGLIASRICRILGGTAEQIDSMFTAGLLHDVGRMLLAEKLGDDYAKVIDTAEALELPLETVESRLLLLNHADLTDRLLRQWHFSPELVNPIALHHLSMGNIRRMAPRMVKEVATLGLANRLAHALVLGCSGNDAIYPISEFVGALNLSAPDIASIAAEVPDHAADMKLTMMSYGAATKSVLEERCGWLGTDVRPMLLAQHPDLSAFGLLLGRLCGGTSAQPPNLLVLRVTQSSDRAAMMGRLKEADQLLGGPERPVLVLGSGAGCLFGAGAFGSRPVEQLTVPLRQSRLIRAMRHLAVGDSHERLAA